MRALQDPGACGMKKKSNGQGETPDLQYPEIMGVAAPVVKQIKKKYGNCGIPKNQTDAKKEIAYHVVRVRKLKDVVAVPNEFRVYANNDGQVYIINHDTTRGGFNVILDAMFSYWESKKSKSVSQRVPNDALRTAAILLDPDNRGTVSIIMSNKNDQKRAHIDQATCPIQAFFNKYLQLEQCQTGASSRICPTS
jgi:hypothetical protein